MRQIPGSALSVALAVLCGAPPIAAQTQESPGSSAVPARTVGPVFHQLVMFTVPAPFTPGSENNNGVFYVRELVPAGESVDDWSRMITLTGTSGLASDERATPQVYLQALTRRFQRHCPQSFATVDLGPATVNAYPGYEVIVSCGHVADTPPKAHSETAIMLAVKGTQDLYPLQWAERGPDSSHALNIDRGYWQAQLAKLNPIKLCPIVPGEATPYPSCTGKGAPQ